jgi:DUF1680 family protein
MRMSIMTSMWPWCACAMPLTAHSMQWAMRCGLGFCLSSLRLFHIAAFYCAHPVISSPLQAYSSAGKLPTKSRDIKTRTTITITTTNTKNKSIKAAMCHQHDKCNNETTALATTTGA